MKKVIYYQKKCIYVLFICLKRRWKRHIVERPMKTMETKSVRMHEMRAFIHEFHLFGNLIKDIVRKKLKLHSSKHFVYAERQIEETFKTR